MKLIPLTQGLFAQVDDADFDWLNQWKWATQFSYGKYYAVRTINYYNEFGKRTTRQIKMHRLILGLTDPIILGDHVDGNGLNCQRFNLRAANYIQNTFNRSKHRDSSSPYKGVSFFKRQNSWKAHICFNGNRVHLGCFNGIPEI